MWHVVGVMDMGEIGNNLETLMTGKRDRPLATHVLQLCFNGLKGFRWPIAYFASRTAKAFTMYPLIWEAVDKLHQHGFTVDYIALDGASTNRSLINMHFPTNPRHHSFTTLNPSYPAHKVVFLQDIKHTFKKIRNSLFSSRLENKDKSGVRGARYILLDDKPVVWDMFEAAFAYNTRFGIRLHKRLTREHIMLDGGAKMRNHIAEHVLNSDMIILIEALRESGECLDFSLDPLLKILKHTSNLVNVFNDKRPICTLQDSRLQTIKDDLSFFNDWESSIMDNSTLTKADKIRHLITEETRDDLNCAITGFLQICTHAVNKGFAVVPAIVNSDAIENFFCQQSGITDGQNTNPTLLQYGYSVNTIILGQCTVSKKANAGGKAQFYKAVVPGALRNKPIRL